MAGDIVTLGGIAIKCSSTPQAGLVNYCNGCFYGYDGSNNLPLSIKNASGNSCFNNVCANSVYDCENRVLTCVCNATISTPGIVRIGAGLQLNNCLLCLCTACLPGCIDSAVLCVQKACSQSCAGTLVYRDASRNFSGCCVCGCEVYSAGLIALNCSCNASCSSPGIVKIGDGICLSGCCIGLCDASATKKGTACFGYGLTVSSGCVGAINATCLVPGIVQIGNGLLLNGCTICAAPGIGCITSDCQIVIGCSNTCNACSDRSVYLGTCTGYLACCSCHSVMIGACVGHCACCSPFSVMIGYNSAYKNPYSGSMVSIGNDAGGTSCCNQVSVFIGQTAGWGSYKSQRSVFIGESSGFEACCSTYSNFIGYIAGDTAQNSWYSNFMGYCAGQKSDSSCYSNFIGYGAGRLTCCANYNNFIGTNSGYKSIQANCSIFIGTCAGWQACCSLCNIFIGFGAGYNCCNCTNLLLIGNDANPLIQGVMERTSSNSKLNILGKVGIETTEPQDILQVGATTSGIASGEDASIIALEGITLFKPDKTTNPEQGTLSLGSTGLYLVHNEYYSGGWNLYNTNKAPIRFAMESTDANSYFVFSTKNANTADSTERMRIDKNGNVGINEISPQEKLHINGNIRIDDSSGNDGFKLSYDNTSKVLNFVFVGS